MNTNAEQARRSALALWGCSQLEITITYDCIHDNDEPEPEPEFEVYWYDEDIGSERIATFRTAEAADKFGRSLAPHKMAHW